MAATLRYARGHSQEYLASSPATADGDSDGGGGGPLNVSLSQEHLEREQQRRKRHSRPQRNRSASNSRSSQERLHWRDSKEDVRAPQHHRYLTGQPLSRSQEYLDQSHYYYRPRHGQDGLGGGHEDPRPRQHHWAQRSYERLDHHRDPYFRDHQQQYSGYGDDSRDGGDHRYRHPAEPHYEFNHPPQASHRGRNHVDFGQHTLPKAPRNSQSSQSSSQAERRPPSSSHNSSDSSTRYPTLKRSGVQVNFQTPPVILPPPPPPLRHGDPSYYDSVDSYHDHHNHHHRHRHHEQRPYLHDVTDNEEGVASEASEDLRHPYPHRRAPPPPPPVRQQQSVLSSAAEGSVSDCQSDSNTEPGSAAAPITVEAQVLVNSSGVILPPPQHGILTNAVPVPVPPPPPPLPPSLEERVKPMNSSSMECNEISSVSEASAAAAAAPPSRLPPMPMEPAPERHNHAMISFQHAPPPPMPPPLPPPSTSPSTTTASAGMPSPSVPSSSRTTSHSSSVENVRQGVYEGRSNVS